MVTVTVQGINADVNTKAVTLIPSTNTTAGTVTAPTAGSSIYQWICGVTGTTVDPKYLPGSCRG